MLKVLMRPTVVLIRWTSLLLLFVLVGEGAIRVDQRFRPFIQQAETIRVEIAESPELAMVREGRMPHEAPDLRVMILGDSYIYGGGIPPEHKFSRVMRQRLLDNDTMQGNCYVLDISRPSNNALDNYELFTQYLEAFQPTHVIVGYNFNDLPANQPESRQRFEAITGRTAPRENIPLRSARSAPAHEKFSLRTLIKAVYRFEVLRFTSAQIQNKLKVAFGIAAPFGDFYYLTHRGYLDSSPPWQLTQTIFRSMAERLEASGARLYVYAFPEINLIERPQLFAQSNAAMKAFFPQLPNTEFFSGRDEFLGNDSAEFRLSKYDGHPNAKAHARMVDTVMSRILSER